MRHVAVVALSALVAACGSEESPLTPTRPSPSAAPVNITGTWRAVVHLTDCRAFDSRRCTFDRQFPRSEYVLVLHQDADGTVQGEMGTLLSSAPVTGTYRDRALQLTRPADMEPCSSSAEWRIVFEPSGPRGSLVIGPDVGGRCSIFFPGWKVHTYEVRELISVAQALD